MKCLIFAAIAACSVAASWTPGPTDTSVDYPNYTFVDLEWVGSFVPGGANITLYGTVESVTAQVEALYPNITSFTSDPDVTDRDTETGLSGDLIPRTPGPVTCNIPWYGGPGMNVILEDGIKYLEAKKNIYCHLGPGPNVCTRVSCSWNSGIFFCNNNEYDIWVLCPVFGQYTQNIIQKCSMTDGRVLGRQDDTYNFYVVAGGGDDGNGKSC